MGGPAASVRAGFALAPEEAVGQEPAVQWPRTDAPPAAPAHAPAGNTTGRLFAGSRIPMGERPAPSVACCNVTLGWLHSVVHEVGFGFGGVISPIQIRLNAFDSIGTLRRAHVMRVCAERCPTTAGAMGTATPANRSVHVKAYPQCKVRPIRQHQMCIQAACPRGPAGLSVKRRLTCVCASVLCSDGSGRQCGR